MSDYDGMGYEELLGECEWMSDFLSMMAERITKDPDVHNLVDYVRKIEDENARLRSCLSDDAENAKAIMGENAKLRKLVRDTWSAFCFVMEGGIMTRDPGNFLEQRMRELGIEVHHAD